MIKSTVATDPAGALSIAKNACNGNPNINVHSIAEIFAGHGRM